MSYKINVNQLFNLSYKKKTSFYIPNSKLNPFNMEWKFEDFL